MRFRAAELEWGGDEICSGRVVIFLIIAIFTNLRKFLIMIELRMLRRR